MNYKYYVLCVMLTCLHIVRADFFSNFSHASSYEDDCSSSPSSFKLCTCPDTGNKGKCSPAFFNEKSHCICSNDECENNVSNSGKPCYCYGTDKSGTCETAFFDHTLGVKCNCANDNPRTRTQTSTRFDSPLHDDVQKNDEPEEIHTYNFALFSTAMDAPIFNIPLQRSTTPSSAYSNWWLALAPLYQSPATRRIEQHALQTQEYGILFNAGFYSWLYGHMLISVAADKKTHKLDNAPNSNVSINVKEFKSVPCDFFIGLGLQTSHSDWLEIHGEIFTAQLDKRIKDHKIIDEIKSTATGIQCSADFCINEQYDRKYELSTLARVTYFIPHKNNFNDDKTGQHIGSVTYSAGTFLDLFLSLKQYYGIDYQHQIEIGYNPTIHVQNSTTTPVKTNRTITFTTTSEEINSVRNTLFGIYAYNWDAGCSSMNISIGATATIIPSSSYGTIFATYGIGF